MFEETESIAYGAGRGGARGVGRGVGREGKNEPHETQREEENQISLFHRSEGLSPTGALLALGLGGGGCYVLWTQV